MIAAPIQYRARCKGCRWDGLDNQLAKVGRFHKCPGCGERRDPSNRNRSILTYYAVHALCGTAHHEGTNCPEEPTDLVYET